MGWLSMRDIMCSIPQVILNEHFEKERVCIPSTSSRLFECEHITENHLNFLSTQRLLGKSVMLYVPSKENCYLQLYNENAMIM